MAATFEIINGILFVTGSLDRATDQELTQALEKYGQAVPAGNRVVDMSNVRWLAPTGGKLLIAAGQESAEKSGSMRVMASRHVLQTLNLLGAKNYLTIESCMSPNPRPGGSGAMAAPVEASTPPEGGAVKPAEAQAAASGTSAPAPSGTPASESSASHAAVAAPVHAATIHAAAPTVRAGTFASPTEELTAGANLLRAMLPNRRYSFHLDGGELMIGIIRERIGGPWVQVETAGTRKLLNLDRVIYVEVL